MAIQINYNGKTYNSLDEMPPEVRAAYQQAMALLADQNGNGMPDFVDGLMQGQSVESMVKPLNVLSSTQIVFNGQTYASVGDMPPEARRAYQQAMGTFDQNRNGVPDALEQGAFQAGQPVVSVSSTSTGATASAPRPAPMDSPYTPAGIESDHPQARAGRLRMMAYVVVGIAAVLLAALAVIILFGLPNLLGPS
jgi:hypothetical protein